MNKIFKNILIMSLRLYKVFVSNYVLGILGVGCRYQKTCSEFAIEAVNEKGVLEGMKLSLIRFLSCHPFSRKNYANLGDIR